MNKIKEWIKEYSILIIACLILALMVRSCGNSMMARRFEYSTNRYEYIIDSLTGAISATQDSMAIVKFENEVLKGTVKDYRKDKEHYIRVNNNLVNVTKNLSKKDTI